MLWVTQGDFHLPPLYLGVGRFYSKRYLKTTTWANKSRLSAWLNTPRGKWLNVFVMWMKWPFNCPLLTGSGWCNLCFYIYCSLQMCRWAVRGCRITKVQPNICRSDNSKHLKLNDDIMSYPSLWWTPPKLMKKSGLLFMLGEKHRGKRLSVCLHV